MNILTNEYLALLIFAPFHSRDKLRDRIQDVFKAFSMNEFRCDHAVVVLTRGKIYFHSESPLYLPCHIADRGRIEAKLVRSPRDFLLRRNAFHDHLTGAFVKNKLLIRAHVELLPVVTAQNGNGAPAKGRAHLLVISVRRHIEFRAMNFHDEIGCANFKWLLIIMRDIEDSLSCEINVPFRTRKLIRINDKATGVERYLRRIRKRQILCLA